MTYVCVLRKATRFLVQLIPRGHVGGFCALLFIFILFFSFPNFPAGFLHSFHCYRLVTPKGSVEAVSADAAVEGSS